MITIHFIWVPLIVTGLLFLIGWLFEKYSDDWIQFLFYYLGIVIGMLSLVYYISKFCEFISPYIKIIY